MGFVKRKVKILRFDMALFWLDEGEKVIGAIKVVISPLIFPLFS